MQTYSLPLPKGSLIARSLDRTDYTDTYGIKTTASIGPEILPPLFFQVFPKWFIGLLYLREAFAGLIGLKTAKGTDVAQQLRNFTGEPGESISLFHILDRNEEEILSGENDRHLDFRLSFLTRPQPEGTELILSTTVQFNGWLGRAYFLPVRPIHRLIIPILLRRMVRRLEDTLQCVPS